MFRWIVSTSLQFRFVLVPVTAVFMFFGVAQLRQMPVDVFPEFAPPRVEIQTEALGLSTNEVEELLTVPLEEALTGTPEREVMRSKSVPGLSSVVITFEPGTDVIRARQFVQERLTTTIGLPKVSRPPVMLQPLSATSRVMMIGLSSKELSLIEMSVLARWTIRPRLMGVPGVANVAIWGQRERQMQVLADPTRLRASGVSIDQVIRTTGNAFWVSPLSFLDASYPGTGGWIDTPQQRLGIRHVLPITTPEELARVPVAGATQRLGDVAEVVEGHPPLIGDALIDEGPGLLLVVEKFPGANTLEVTRGVEAALEALRPGLPGLQIDPQVFRTAAFIEVAFDNLTRALLIGTLLVVLALFAFYYDWRSALISLVAIPVSMLAALGVFYVRGATFNTMVLAGLVIALAAVVDDAIIDIENVVRRLRQHRHEGRDTSIAAILLDASLEMRGGIAFAALIVVLAALPVFFIQGLSGAFFSPLALSYVLAVLASMVVALTVTPALGLILLRNGPSRAERSPLVRRLQRGYDAVLSRVLQRPRPAYFVLGVFVLAGLVVWPFLGQELLPSFKERDLMIRWEGAPGVSYPEMLRIMTRAGGELRAIPGVRKVTAQMGRAVLGDQVVGINSGQLWVSIDPKADYDATVAAIQQVVDGYPGLSHDVQTYLKDRIREVLTGASKAIVVRIYGPQLDVLRGKAEEVRLALSEIEGVVDLQTEVQIDEPHVAIKVDLAKAGRYGLSPGDVRRAAAALVAGIGVANLYEGQKVFDVAVWAVPQTRQSLTSLRELLIPTPSGESVRLGDVAEVRVASSPTVIRHENMSLFIDVLANVRGRDLGSVTREVERRLRNVEFPLEYHPEVLGEYAERQAARNRMLQVAAAAAIGIFLLLQAVFQSWRLASLAFLILPATLVGGFLAAFAGGGVITLGSLVAFLGVLGIAARHGVMLVHHYQHLEQHEGTPFGPGLVLQGSRDRMAPILMTAATTGAALLPFALFGNIPGLEIVHPMAIVILGGLVTSTLLNLFVLPVLYWRFGPYETQQ